MQSLNRLKSERPRRKFDFYETPKGLCKASLRRFVLDETNLDRYAPFMSVLDPGCGSGVWESALYEMYNVSVLDQLSLDGIDMQEKESNLCYTGWFVGDFLDFNISDKYDLVMGNPPYSLAEEFVRHSMSLIDDGGYVFFLLRLAFLESKKRHFGLFTEFQPKRVYVLSRRPSFFSSGNDGKKTTDALAYAMFLWQKGWSGKTELDWLYWSYE